MSNSFRTHMPGLPEPGRWLTVAVPPSLFLVMLLLIVVWYDAWYFLKNKEGGIEWIAIAILLIGVGYGAVTLLKYRASLPKKWLVGWFTLATLGMFVFAGEEMSWGQHLGFWSGEDLPEGFRELNDQDETNFHNMTNALDQGPTNIIFGGTLFAFVVLPFLQRHKGKPMDFADPGYWFWPTRAGLVAGIGVILIPFPKRIYEWVTGEPGSFDWRHSEIHEFYIALLMTTYMVSLHLRLKAYSSREQG